MHFQLKSVMYSLVLVLLSVAPVVAQEPLKRFPAADSDGVEASRDDNKILLSIKDQDLRTLSIPRLGSAMRSAAWSDGTENITVRPEQETWVLKWKDTPADAATIVLTFGSRPLLMSELQPISASTDGSYYLPAHHAKASGEKIRYEPQSYKNTVGYWVGAKDHADWSLSVSRAGKFNVCLLQGCGAKQGGSDVRLSIRDGNEVAAKVDFQVLETGHFQNFQWRTVGVLELEPGLQTLRIEPIKIANKALMDVRAVHLVRLPDPKN